MEGSVLILLGTVFDGSLTSHDDLVGKAAQAEVKYRS